MLHIIRFLFWPFPEFFDKWERMAGAIETWLFVWAFLGCGIILPVTVYLKSVL